MRRNLIIIISALALIGGSIYIFIFRTSQTPDLKHSILTPSPIQASNNSAIPTHAPSRSITALSSSIALPSLYTHNDGSVFFYSPEGAWRVRPGAGGEPEVFSDVKIDGLHEVVWSPNGDEVITMRQSDTARSVVYFDYKTANAQPIIPAARGIVWSPGGNDIAYQEKDDAAGVNQIVRASARGENPRILFRTRVDLWRLYWPTQDRIYAASAPSGLAQGTLFAVSPEDGAIRKLFAAYGLIALPAPDGKQILYSATNERGSGLALRLFQPDATPQERDLTAEFGILALADKCVWTKDSRSIVCAAFRDQSPSAILPDDYYKGVFSSVEQIYALNLETQARAVIDLDGEMTVSNPALTSSEGWLVFINRKDGKLYGTDITKIQNQ